MQHVSQVSTPDGRVLEVHAGGDPAGRTVVLHHGTPAGGLLYDRDDALAATLGLRLIGYDRPGYGGSTRDPGRTVAGAAADVLTILDALGVERFATWGMSGGGPHALACAALAPERCAVAVTVAGVAPFDARGLDWLAGMGDDNVAEFGAARAGEEALAAYLTPFVPELRDADPAELVAAMRSVLSDVDAAALTDALGDHLAAATAHGLAPGGEGWIDDDLAFARPWGFSLDAIAVPVEVWQGEHDLMVPPAHGRWLAQHVARADLHFREDDGHLSLLDSQVPAVYAAMARYTF
ncbi:MAG: alpha/beta hydrolase fold protein [Conexibacter sp.]|jgi:pimeloyl-ACP methyl ester carboxylesterase|nr:alpha/beta hydrolase fold protein [Conexibacter sp.]